MTMEADFDIPVQFQRLRREAVLAIRTNPNDTDLAGLGAFFAQAATATGGSAGGGAIVVTDTLPILEADVTRGYIDYDASTQLPGGGAGLERTLTRLRFEAANGNQVAISNPDREVGEIDVGQMRITLGGVLPDTQVSFVAVWSAP